MSPDERAENLRQLSTNLSQADQEQINRDVVQQLCTHAAAAANELVAFQRRIDSLDNRLDPERISNQFECMMDIFRLLYVVVLAMLAFLYPSVFAGRLAAGGGMLYVFVILVAVVIRSDGSYAFTVERREQPLRKTQLGRYAYHVIPSFFSAVPVLVGIVVDVWLGFAALYSTQPPGDACDYGARPFAKSFLTLATFAAPSGPISEDVRCLVLMEITCGLVLMYVILALLISRLSNFK